MPAIKLDDSALLLQPLGDLVFCPMVITAEASAQGKTCQHHWMHLTIHGTLHLCGFDHVTSVAADTMESLEIQILSGFGVANPYRQQTSQSHE